MADEETTAAYGPSPKESSGRATGKRLVMLGYFGFGNTGDEAVLAAEVAALRDELGPQTSFLVVSGDPAHTRATHDLPAIRRTDVRALLAALWSADVVIAGGGSLLQDVTSARPVAFYAGVMSIAARMGTPVFGYAQGLGPLRRSVNRRLAGSALRRATYVGLRDTESARLAGELGVSSVDQVPDPVLGMTNLGAPATGKDASARQGPTAPGRGLMVALRPWVGQDRWFPVLASAVRELAESVEVRVVAFHHGQDIALARALAAELPSNVEVVDPAAGYRAVLDAMADSRVVLGMRLHALIAASAAERPFVALSYDPKVAAFAELVEQPVAADLTRDAEPSAPAIVEAVRNALGPADPAYAARVQALREAARAPAQAVGRWFAGHGDCPQRDR